MTVPGDRPIFTRADAYAGKYPTKQLEKFMDEIEDFLRLVDDVPGSYRNANEKLAAAIALHKSFMDWRAQLKTTRRRQRELDDYEDD